MGFTVTVMELLAFLRSKGFTIQAGKGKHGTKAVRGKQKIPIPIHGGGVLAKGTLKSVLYKAGYTADDVMEWRQQ